MAAEPLPALDAPSPAEQLRLGREIVRAEGTALLALAERLGEDFCRALDLVLACRGCVIVSGMGKAGIVGQKLAATFASTGTRSHYLHPAEAVHGDLGRVHRDDLLLVLSASGETEEVVRLLAPLRDKGVALISITGQPKSTLARASRVVLDLGVVREACPLGLAPSTSTTAMLALGDALALVAAHTRRFSAEDFARHHPGGSLGRKLTKVAEAMRPLVECRVAPDSWSVREVFVSQSRPGRRTGAIMLVDGQGRLSGIFTDSDLARLLERKRDQAIDGPIREVMTQGPATVLREANLAEACELLAQRKISELPVIDAEGRPVGLIDITDVVSLRPEDETSEAPPVLRLAPLPADRPSRKPEREKSRRAASAATQAAAPLVVPPARPAVLKDRNVEGFWD